MNPKQFTGRFSDYKRLAAWLLLAQSHGGQVVPAATKRGSESGMGGEVAHVSVTVEIGALRSKSFELCAKTTGLLEKEVSLLEQ